MWGPTVLFIWVVVASTWIAWVGGSISHLQGLVSALLYLQKSDIQLELRRLLGLARAHARPFRLTYTRLPPSVNRAPPSVWRDYEGQSVTLSEDPMWGARNCTVRGGGAGVGGGDGFGTEGERSEACSEREAALAFAPPPPRWLAMILMAYPVPLLPESPEEPGHEIHCSA